MREACKQQLLDALMTLVRENGVDYNDYYRNEHGIEEDDGYTVVKVFDIACFGCYIGLPLKWCVEIEDDADPTPKQLSDNHYTHVVCYDLGDGRNEAGTLEEPDSLYDDYTNLLWRVLGTKRILV